MQPIREYVDNIAAKMGIALSVVSVADTQYLGFIDVLLVHLTVRNKLVSVWVHQFELDELQNSSRCDSLEARLRTAMSQLQMMSDP